MDIASILKEVSNFVWGPVMLAFLVGTGLYLMILLKFRPLTRFGHALKQATTKPSSEESSGDGDISAYQSLMASVGTAIGSGNIVGVATAMVLGGAGALFWMWVSAILGFATKYAESVLAVEYREINNNGEIAGGPMYTLKNGFKIKWLGSLLAIAFAFFTVLASFGIGNMTQSNSIAQAMFDVMQVPAPITGALLAVVCAVVIFGGIKSIGKVSGYLVPVMTSLYMLGALLVIITHIKNLPSGVMIILENAFSFNSVGGGVAGYVFVQAMRYGVARGVFSNEAGLGSAGILAASAKTDHPCRQGYINMTAVFFDTILVCTLTGLAIACSGVLGSTDANGELINGATLSIMAFSSTFGDWVGYVITFSLIMFIFSTIIGWGYYGEKGLEYLVKSDKYKNYYRAIFVAMIFVGSITQLNTVWYFSDIANGLMAIPNLISLIILSKVVVKLTNDYDKKFLNKK